MLGISMVLLSALLSTLAMGWADEASVPSRLPCDAQRDRNRDARRGRRPPEVRELADLETVRLRDEVRPLVLKENAARLLSLMPARAEEASP
jgi:hypothetical protein